MKKYLLVLILLVICVLSVLFFVLSWWWALTVGLIILGTLGYIMEPMGSGLLSCHLVFFML